MLTNDGFTARRVYPSPDGLAIEHYTEDDALAAYQDAIRKNKTVTLDGLVLTWHFKPSLERSLDDSPTKR
jgi:hypothetical protein